MTAILKITNGITEIDLTGQSGPYCLKNWEQTLAQLKGGGVFQDSVIAEGRVLVSGELENVSETITLSANASTQDELIEQAEQELVRLLNYMRKYWIERQTKKSPVYLVAKSALETNTRYATIHGYGVATFPNAYHQPFFNSDSTKANYSDFDIIIERGQWGDNPPGVGSAVVISSEQEWIPTAWELRGSSDFANNEVIKDILQKTSTGDLYAITAEDTGSLGNTNGEIRKSTDNGVNWALSFATGGGTNIGNGVVGGALLVYSNGDIYAGTGVSSGSLQRSQDDGATWPTLITFFGLFIPSDFIIASDSRIYTTVPQFDGINMAEGKIYRSDTSGENFTQVFTSSFGVFEAVQSIIQLQDGSFLAAGQRKGTGDLIYKSFTGANGTWFVYRLFSGGNGRITAIKQLNNGNILYVNSINRIFKSVDNGITWVEKIDFPGTAIMGDIVQINNGIVYVTTGSNLVFLSPDFGETWVDAQIITAARAECFYQVPSDNALWVGVDDEAQRQSQDIVELGGSGVYVSSKRNIANITHIKLFDNSLTSYLDAFPSTLPLVLFPSVPITNNDSVYFGINVAATTNGTFSSLVFNISVINQGLTLIWEYYNGVWVTLTVTDNTNSFVNGGSNILNFEVPTDWINTVIDTVDCFWIRVRVTANTAPLVSPVQQLDQIYSVVQPYIEIASTEVGGDILALAKLKLINVSDLDGQGGGSPTLYDNRLLTAVKLIDVDNEDFTMFINAGTLQNTLGVTTTVGTNTLIATNITTPSTEETIYTPLGTEAIADRLVFTLSTTIARNFFGIYRLFLRGRQVGGVSGDIFMRVVIQSGSGGIKSTSPQVIFETNQDWSLVDFGEIEIPVSSDILPTELADTISITMQAGSLNATPLLHIYDIVLLPVDGVWNGDYIDQENIVGSEIRNNYSLNLDSISNPKADRSLVINESAGSITARYQDISTPPRLPNNERCRIYVLPARYGPVGEWVSEPGVVHCVELQANQRYIAGRGSR